MNRRTFLKLSAYTGTWLTLAQHQFNNVAIPAGAQSTIPQAAYGANSYGQGIYIGAVDVPQQDEAIYLPTIFNGGN